MLNMFQRLKRLLGRNHQADTTRKPSGQSQSHQKDSIQEIYSAIGNKLSALMPEGAEEITYTASIHNKGGWTSERAGIDCWTKTDGSLGHYTEVFPRPPYEDERAILDDLKRLRDTPLYVDEPWSDVRVSLTRDGKIRFEFAYIHSDDAWLGLSMKGVSELTRREAALAYIDEGDWINMCKAAIERKSAAAQQADEEGNQALANGLRGEVDAIKKRLADAVS